MLRIIKYLLLPWIITLKGCYKCLCYGNQDQLLLLMITLATFLLNVKCSKTIDFEDVAILISFIYIMHYFSKLEKENLYLSGDIAKAMMGILYRQKKVNKKASEQARDLEKQMKKLGNGSVSNGQRPQKVFVLQINKDKKEELPKNKHYDIKSNPVIELGESEYKTIDDNKFLEGGNLL
jgi:hypothetical protein